MKSGKAADVRNERLYEALKGYYRRAATMLNRRLRESGDPDEFMDVRPRFEFAEGRRVSQFQSQEVQWWKLVSRNKDGLRELDEFAAVMEALSEDETIAQHLDGQVRFPGYIFGCPDADGCVDKLLGDLLYEQDGGFDETVLDTFYGRVEAFFYGDRLELRYLAPLSGFWTEEERVELGGRLWILRIPDAERSEMLSASVEAAPFARSLASGLRTHGLELYVEVGKRVGVEEGSADEDVETDPNGFARLAFEEACCALRVFKAGEVGFDQIRSRPTCWDPVGATICIGPADVESFFPESYVLQRREVGEFLKFWDRWAAADRGKDLNLAVRRFNLGCQRRLPEEKLIEYMIGFEALLLESESELKYRLALRAAALLGRDANDRESIRAELEAAYRQRNRIVHGNELEDPAPVGKKERKRMIPFVELVYTIEDHLRSLTRERIEGWREWRKDRMIDELDRRIVRGLGHKRSI